jgi:hypothetical protein
MTLPTTSHGYPIIDRKPSCVAGSEVVLAKRDHPYHPFVVWRMEADTGVCEGGDYCATLAEGLAAFTRRA